uniref:DNA 5'-3' helicase FANCJ n=1 Tax=Nelumbo nucifera TaxID=4432 RepID=A0A822ZUJ2_NELNU|nr:TPA_asm: hypothetical protein HUJ06_016473 [Nelumbo nucifera]
MPVFLMRSPLQRHSLMVVVDLFLKRSLQDLETRKVIGIGRETNGIYLLGESSRWEEPVDKKSFVSQFVSPVMLWHNQLGNIVSENVEAAPSATNSKSSKKKTVPTIIYASRTHSQISQLIREYRKTSYRVPMAVLASRKHYCTNKRLRGKENVQEECKLLLKDQVIGCPEFKNAHKVKYHPSLQKGGCYEVHDIEDVVKVGQLVKGCSYFGAWGLSEDAWLIFCPYNYVISPIIRRGMEVDLKGAIVILDEAHNIEDMARGAGSVEVEEDMLYTLQMELGQLSLADAVTYQPLHETIQGIISWMGSRKCTLEKREFQRFCSCWTGDKALVELQEAGISQQCFPILKQCANKAIRAASDAESEGPHLSGMSVAILEGLFCSLSYFFSENGLHVPDYQLALQQYVKRDAGHASSGWTYSLSLWCLNPAVVFKEIADLSMSVILTSGTLSPMGSFSSELGVQFETCMEAPHVIDVESQLWAAAISTGPGNYPLNASYKTADGYAFQDALGASVEEICKIVPAGALVFFPSYKLMEKLCNRWRETGQWSRLNAQKTLFVEPRGNQDEFEPVLKGYYDAIHGGTRLSSGKSRRGKKQGTNHSDLASPQNCSKRGAAFLAVCRGKVSEGIDFSDENARVVIIVGIPFPNINDMQVAQKKKYNDTYRLSKNLLSGSEWYCQQAFRALNQAAGRCIRHRFDHGAIILMDERFREERNMAYISKWLRKSIKQYDNFNMFLEGLRSFSQDAKEQLGQKVMEAVENSVLNDENAHSTKQKLLSKAGPKKKNQMMDKSNHYNGWGIVSNNITATEKSGHLSQILTWDYTNSSQFKDHDIVEAAEPVQVDDKATAIQHNIDPKYLRSPDIFVVKETPEMSEAINISSPGALSKENSDSTIVQASTDSPGQLSCHSASYTNSSRNVSKVTCSLVVTPERNINGHIESSLNLSVNSHTQKRRIECIRNFTASRDVDQSIEFSMDADNSECKYTDYSYGASSLSSDPTMERKLHICCSICRTPLGLPENNFLVVCLLTLSSKFHVASLVKGGLDSPSRNGPGVPVVISEVSSVDQRLCNRPANKSASKHGVWCEEDGCVFNTIFCPFCGPPSFCLGLQIVAADAQNVHLLNRIMFFLERLEIKDPDTQKEENILPRSHFDVGQTVVLPLNDKFSCSPPQPNSGGWRTKRAKLKLAKKGLLSKSKDQG